MKLTYMIKKSIKTLIKVKLFTFFFVLIASFVSFSIIYFLFPKVAKRVLGTSFLSTSPGIVRYTGKSLKEERSSKEEKGISYDSQSSGQKRSDTVGSFPSDSSNNQNGYNQQQNRYQQSNNYYQTSNGYQQNRYQQSNNYYQTSNGYQQNRYQQSNNYYQTSNGYQQNQYQQPNNYYQTSNGYQQNYQNSYSGNSPYGNQVYSGWDVQQQYSYNNQRQSNSQLDKYI